MKVFKIISLWALIVFVSIAIGIFAINSHIVNVSNNYIFNDYNKLPNKTAVLVLGAQVYGEQLSLVLEDRVNAGIQIYKSGKVKKIILSGDHGQKKYDEVNAMKNYVLTKHPEIPVQDIFLDHAGFDTYDSVYRAKQVFEADNLIIVTQQFHINRAIYLALSVGIDAVGFSVSQDKYIPVLKTQWKFRESLSRVKAYFDILFDSKPTFGGEKIPVFGDGRKSWD